MAKQPGQLGQNAIWDGPLSEAGRPLAKGNPRYGENCMQILKAPTPYLQLLGYCVCVAFTGCA